MRYAELFEKLNVNSRMKRWYIDEKCTIIVEMTPELFLLLASTPDGMDQIEDEVQTLDQYNSYDISIPPNLTIQKDGKIVGHEGRHRSMALIRHNKETGENNTIQVGIKVIPSSRSYSIKDIPPTWVGQYSGKSYSFLSLLSSGKLEVIDDNVQRGYQ